MKRRQFLAVGIRAGGLAAVAGTLPRSAATLAASPVEDPQAAGASPAAGASRVAGRQPGPKLKLSCAAYSFRDRLSGSSARMSLEDFIDLCAREGLDGTELTSYYFRRTDPEYLASLRRRALVNGLEISGVPVGNDFCLPAGEKRDEQIANVRQWIERAAALGAPTVRVFAGSVPAGTDAKEAVDRAVAGLAEAAAHAGKHGVVLGLENHGGVTATVSELLEIVTRVGSPWLGVNLDTGNFHSDVYKSLEIAAPYAVCVQVKVEVQEKGQPAVETDFDRIVAILRGAAYRGHVALEFEGKGDPAVEVPRYLAKLRAAIA